jgi:DnaJ-domain-containing protein 1
MHECPFQLFGIEPRFEVDPRSLRQRLLRESARRHPDRAPDAVTAAAWTAELAALNQAADRLLDDLQRAEHLVVLRGGPAPGDDRTLPDGFLESMLQIRMELEEAVAGGDQEGRAALEAWGRREWEARRARVAGLLDAPDGETPDTLLAVRRELNCWRYSQRMLEQLDRSGGD